MTLITVKRLLCLAAAVTLAGCASHPDPIIDKRGVDMGAYNRDLAECREYAIEVSVVEGAARGAAVGAIVGVAVGTITGDTGEGAGYGAATGGVRSGIRNKDTKENVVKRCVSLRGYRVLN